MNDMKKNLACVLFSVAGIFSVGHALAVDVPVRATSYSMRDGAELSAWSHPVHDVLKKYGVVLKSVTVKDNYATFGVKFPFDPFVVSNERKLQGLLFEVLKANGWWDYTILVESGGVVLKVQWDKHAKIMVIDGI